MVLMCSCIYVLIHDNRGLIDSLIVSHTAIRHAAKHQQNAKSRDVVGKYYNYTHFI